MHEISNDACSATAHDAGALITSWQPTGGRDVLFFSDASTVGGEVHGGIPICAPWFGRGREGVEVPRKHGIVRYADWRLLGRTDGDEASTLSWELTGAELAGQPGADRYPGSIWFRYTATLGRTLTVELNIGADEEFILDQAFHTYFAVNDVRAVAVTGLNDVSFQDFAEPHVEAGPTLRPQGAIDRVYSGCEPIQVRDGDRTIHIGTRGAKSTVVWNPGPDTVMPGMQAGDWTSMLCVEVGNVMDRHVVVPAGGSHTLAMHLEVDQNSK